MARQLDDSYRGSIISGTMRPEDLIPAFLQAIHQVDPQTAERYDKECAEVLQEEDPEAISEIINELFDILNEIAPEGTCFSAHSGDGADYGFWPVEGEIGG